MTIALTTLGMLGGGGARSVSIDIPYVDNFSPQTGSLLRPYDTISFDIVDAGTQYKVVFVTIEVAGNVEVAFDGANFGPMYSNVRNFLTPITNGYTFSFARDVGWTSAPILTPYAMTINGDINV